mmetsp:Transcript_58584/g.67530  ORF Transcript_58584/g.67530 Transcript_58584/m.67530 type:complete len:90 (+) Transcript_58584:823-1092(+)
MYILIFVSPFVCVECHVMAWHEGIIRLIQMTYYGLTTRFFDNAAVGAAATCSDIIFLFFGIRYTQGRMVWLRHCCRCCCWMMRRLVLAS